MNNEEVKERNMQNVIEKTIECFENYGIEPTTIAMVAKKSGVTTRSIQRYFHSKDNLVFYALKLFLKQSYLRVKTEFEVRVRTANNGLEEFEISLAMIKQYLKGNFKDLTRISEMESYLIKQKMDHTIIREYFRNTFFIRLLLKEAIERGIQDGSIRSDVDTGLLTDTILGSYVGLMQRLDAMDNYARIGIKLEAEEQIKLYEKMMIEFIKK